MKVDEVLKVKKLKEVGFKIFSNEFIFSACMNQKIPFQEYDVEKTRKGKKDFAELKGRGVPILLVRGQRMNGFSASRFERLYESRKR